MAAVKKSTKLNFYKFVDVKDPATATTAKGAESRAIAVATNRNTEAINNIGDVLNGFIKGIANLNNIQLENLEEQKKNRTKFKAEYNTTKRKKNVLGTLAGIAKGVGSFWDGILGLLGSLFKLFIVLPALKWLADPKNREKVVGILEGIAKVAKFIFDWAKFGVVNTIEGLYKLLSDDTSWWDKLIGFGQAFVGLGAIFLGLRWLKNPFRIITDLFNVLNSFRKNLLRSKSALRRRRGGLGGGGGRRGGFVKGALMFGGGMVAGAALNQAMQGPAGEDGADGQDADPETMKKMVDQKFAEYEVEKKSQGGKVKNLPERSQGGFISGPQSGYKVSLDGGRSTSFIGHGTEYVARKANGGAFVVPINTPGTKTQPHLTQKRVQEAKSQGYSVPGMAIGGDYLKAVKENDRTQGDNSAKKIFLHWSAGHRDGTNFYKGHGYHTYIPSSGQPVRKAPFGKQGSPYHTYGRPQSQSAAIGVAGMSTANNENGKDWGSQAITPNQYKGMAKEAAAIATAWGWKPSDITDKRVRTHAEEYRDYPNWYHRNNSSHYRWDLSRLYAGEPAFSGGPKIRNMIKQEMGGAAGDAKDEPDAKDGARQVQQPRGIMSNFLGAIDAMTGGRTDFDGMGGGQRNITNPDQKGEKEANTREAQESKDKKQGMVFPLPNGRFAAGPRQVYGAGRSYGGHAGIDLTEMPPFGSDPKIPVVAAISGTVLKEKYKGGQTYYSGMMIQGEDGYDQRYLHMEPTVKPGQKVQAGQVIGKLYDDADNTHLHFEVYKRGKGGHLNPAQIYPDLFKPGATGGGGEIQGSVTPPGATNPPDAPGTDSAANPSGAANVAKTIIPKASSAMSFEERYGSTRYTNDNFELATKKEEERRQQLQAMLPNMSNAMGPGAPQAGQQQGASAKQLQKITKDRNNARQLVQNRTQEMIQQVMAQVAKQNGMNQQMAQQASLQISQMMQQSMAQQNAAKNAPPQVVGGGGGGAAGGGGRGTELVGGIVKTTASALNSNLNPLKGLF